MITISQERVKQHAFPKSKRFIINKRDPRKIHRCDNYQLNFHGHLLIHYKLEYTVMRKITHANKVTVVPWYTHHVINSYNNMLVILYTSYNICNPDYLNVRANIIMLLKV